MGGGGGAEVKDRLGEAACEVLSGASDDLGVFGICAADDVMVADQATFRRRNVPTALYSFLSTGDKIRDWSVEVLPTVFFPYVNFEIASLDHSIHALRYMWPSRTALVNAATFSVRTYASQV